MAGLLLCGMAFGQNGALRITEPAPSNDGTVVTSNPSISLQGTLAWTGGDRRVLWQSNRGFSDLATVTATGDGRTVLWNSTSPVPLRPGVNHVRVEAMGQPGAAAFVNIFYTPQTPANPAPLRTTMLHGRRIAYEVVDGRAVYQSDLILGTAVEVAAGRLRGRFAAGARPGAHPHSATIAPNLLQSSGLWPVVNGIVRVPYTSTGVNAANINAAIAESNTQLAGILQWVPAAAEDVNLVNFNFDPNNHSGSCEANVGMTGGVQSIGGSVDCTTVTVLHEMGHALGLFHEQSRADRNNYVNYLEANIDKPQYANFDIYDSGVDSGLYNYASIMEYGPFSFSKDGISPVLETIPAGIGLGSSLPQYTTGDLDGILRLYLQAPSSITVDTNPSGLQVVVDGTPCTAPCLFSNWALNTQHTLSAPLDANNQTLQTLSQQPYLFGRWNAGSANQRTVTITNSAGNGTLLQPSTAPAITNYLASFIPIHPYNPVVFPAGKGAITASPPASSLIIGGTSTSYYQDRQLVTFTVRPNTGYTFYDWYNLYAFTFYANPYTLYISNNFDYFNFDITKPTTAYLVTDPVTTITAQSPDIGAAGTFPGFAIGVVETSNGGAVTTAYTPRNYAGSVDGAAGFGNGRHITLCGSALSGASCPGVPVAQSPVTTNIRYLFSNWTGTAASGADALNIAVPASGQGTYTANYAPSFRAIVAPSLYCAGAAVTSSPGGTSSTGTGGTLDAFFPIGSVSFTANPGASGLAFSGWSQDLNGATNPLSLNVQGQLLGTANFSVAGSPPLTITSLSPAAPVATTGPVDLVVTGTGFTTDNTVTFVYWLTPDGTFLPRTSALTSATHLTLHLEAGDLSTAGFYQIAVLNAVTSGCNPTAYFTFPVANSAGPPTFSIGESHTGNFAQGQQNVQHTILVTNSGAVPITLPVTVTDALPSGETYVSMSGSGWDCSTAPICARSDTLPAGLSYPAITLTVNVAANAPSQQVNSATVTGGGANPATAADSTVIVIQTPVPNVVALTQSAATTAIQNADLVVGTVTMASSTSVAAGGVISEIPAAGTLVGAGSTVNLTVSTGPPSLQSIAVTPANSSIAKGSTQQFSAVGTYSDLSTQNLTSAVIWASVNTSTVTITAGGMATGAGIGTSIVSATLGGVQGSTGLTVTAATLQSIVVTPASPSIVIGLTQQFTATGKYTDNSMQSLTGSVTWSSTASSVATVTAVGLATGVGAGATTIGATLGAITGSVILTVTSLSKCDINQDGLTNVADVQKMVNEALGAAPGANDLNGDSVVNVVDVQIAINAALGLGCTAK